MSELQFGNIGVNKVEKTFSIVEGSVGSYDYRDVIAIQIIYEEDRYKGKTPMFSHVLQRGSILSNCLYIGNVWCGLCMQLQNGLILYAYMSKQATQYNSLQFHEDTRNCEAFIAFLRKHRVHFKNVYFNTDQKSFTIYKGSVGTYKYPEICKCKMMVEYENMYGEIEHLAQYNMKEQTSMVFVKVLLYLKNEDVLEVCISNQSVQLNSRQFYIDQNIAKDLITFIKRIIKKYKE